MASKVQADNAALEQAMAGQAAAKRVRKSRAKSAQQQPATTVAKAAPRSKSTAKAAPAKKGSTMAGKVRAEFTKNPDARPVDVAKATGVNAAYVWDIRAAMRKVAAKA